MLLHMCVCCVCVGGSFLCSVTVKALELCAVWATMMAMMRRRMTKMSRMSNAPALCGGCGEASPEEQPELL